MTTVARELSHLLSAIANCEKTGNTEWESKHTLKLQGLINEKMPSGSGFDSGTKLDTDKSTPEKLVFTTAFHHMNENGMYDGWTEHTVTVKASLLFSLDMHISGHNTNDIKNLIHDEFYSALTGEI